MKVEELILARCINDVDPWNDEKTSLEVGRYYLPELINIGQSCSDVVIDGKSYNSILFDFYDSRLEEIDIYHSKYSPYFREEDKEIETLNYQNNSDGSFWLNGKKYNSEPIKILAHKLIELIKAVNSIKKGN